MKATTWSDMFPDGRTIYYEGDDPQAFVEEIKQRFGFDPSEIGAIHHWTGERFDGWTEERGYCFLCPAEYLDAIYGGDYPMGS